jgi:predicted ATPase
VDSLLISLVTSLGRRRSRDEIIDAMWPEANPQAGASNLRYIMHLLRRNLGGGDPSPVLSERSWIALNPAYRWDVDLERFEELIASGQDIACLQEAAELRRGEPLIEARYDDWAIPIRARMQREWREVCLGLGRLHRACGAIEDALRWLEQALEADPLDEEALGDLLQVLIGAGRAPAALRRYQHYAALLQAEMELAPGQSLQAIVTQSQDKLAGPPLDRTVYPVETVPSYPLSLDGTLVGREAEMRAILENLPASHPLPALAHGGGAGEAIHRLVLLAGDAGVGKTGLLAEVARHAGEQDLLILAGGCYEQEGRLPYGPIHDALLDYVRAQPEAALRAYCRELLPDLARIVPELRARLGGEDETPHEERDDQRLRVFAAVAQLLERMADERRLVILVDDLQWADGATLQLLHYLARQRQLTGVLFVGAYRADEVSSGAPLAELLAEAHQDHSADPQVKIVTLEPLDMQDTGALLCDRLGAACTAHLMEAIHRVSGGNPFFVLQILALLREEARLERVNGAWQLRGELGIELPPSVRETVARRLRGLGPQESEALRTGAVLGRLFTYAALEAVWDGDADGLCEALDTVIETHLLQEMDEGYAFPQPLLREVVYDRIPLHRRRQMHRRAGLALEAAYGDCAAEHVAELAWHFLQADDLPHALSYAVMAGDQAMTAYTHEEAERQYRSALDLARRTDQGALPEADLLLKLGRILRMTARREEAVSLLEQAARLYTNLGDPVSEGLALVHLAKTYQRSAMSDQATATLARVEALRGAIAACPGPTHALVSLHDELGNLYFWAGRYQDALAAREAAMEIARALGDERLLVRAEVGRAVALAMLGHLSEAGESAQRLIPRAEAAGDREALRLALAQAAESALVAGAFAHSRAYRDRELEVAARLGAMAASPFTLSNLAQLTLYLGEWAAAQQYAEQALEALRAAGSINRSIYPLSFLGELSLRRGDWEAASLFLEEAAGAAERVGDLQVLRYAQRILGERDVLAGHPDEAVMRLEPLLDRPGFEELDVTYLLPTLAWAHLVRGDVARAVQLVATGLARAAAQGNRLALQDGQRVQGMVLARQGHWEEAESTFDEAAQLAGEMPYPYAEARTRAEHGLLAGHRDRRTQAQALLEQAAAIFQRLGAARDVQRAWQALTALDRPADASM